MTRPLGATSPILRRPWSTLAEASPGVAGRADEFGLDEQAPSKIAIDRPALTHDVEGISLIFFDI